MIDRKRLLAVGLDDDLREKIAPALGRGEYDVDLFARYESASELVADVAFDVVLVHCRQPDSAIDDLIAAIRRPGSASQAAHTLVFAASANLDVARSYVARGASRELSTDSDSLMLQEAILGLLRARPRLATRVMARLTVRLGDAASRILCQTRDLSRSGMLAVLDERYPIGSPVQFVLDLPDEREGVRGEAEVVRQATRPRDAVDGLGLRFLSFRGGDEARLAAFLAKHDA